MILNYKDLGGLQSYMGGRVLVDGREIRLPWYIDTEAGIVKTYDVLGDAEAHAVSRDGVSGVWKVSDFPGREGDCPHGGVLSETLRGRVELIRPEVAFDSIKKRAAGRIIAAIAAAMILVILGAIIAIGSYDRGVRDEARRGVALRSFAALEPDPASCAVDPGVNALINRQSDELERMRRRIARDAAWWARYGRRVVMVERRH